MISLYRLLFISMLFSWPFVSSLLTPDPPQRADFNSRYPPILTGANVVTLKTVSSSGIPNSTTAVMATAVLTEGTNPTTTAYKNVTSAISELVSRGFDVIRLDITCSKIRGSAGLSLVVAKAVWRGAIIDCPGGASPLPLRLFRGVPKTLLMRFTNKGGKAGASYSPRVIGAADIDVRVPQTLASRTANQEEIIWVTFVPRDSGGKGKQWRQTQVLWVDNATGQIVLEWLYLILME